LMAQTYDLLLTCVDGDAIDVGDDVGQETTDHVWCGWQAALYIFVLCYLSCSPQASLADWVSVRNTTRDKRPPFSLGS
jgi:hypothetical protein